MLFVYLFNYLFLFTTHCSNIKESFGVPYRTYLFTGDAVDNFDGSQLLNNIQVESVRVYETDARMKKQMRTWRTSMVTCRISNVKLIIEVCQQLLKSRDKRVF